PPWPRGRPPGPSRPRPAQCGGRALRPARRARWGSASAAARRRTLADGAAPRIRFLARGASMRQKAIMESLALRNRRVFLCVGGGIAAYKACEVARLLVKAGASVRCALTPAAQRFVTPLSFHALTGNAVATGLWDGGGSDPTILAAGHVSLADWAGVAVIAPATADLLAK